MRAIRNAHLSPWPSLTTTLIHKHLPDTTPSDQRNLDQELKNIRSTKPLDANTEFPDIVPLQEPNNIKTSDIMCTIISTEALSNKSYLDQTGKFPITSSRRNT